METTARLAHLNMDKEELGAIFPQFEQTIGFFDGMEKAETDPSFSTLLKLHTKSGKPYPGNARFVDALDLRSDSVKETDALLKEELLNNAGERNGNFFVIPNVL